MGVHRLESPGQLFSEAAGQAVGAVRSPAGRVLSDKELLAACRRGDQDAWEVLLGRYERLVFSVALRNGVGHDEAADITQATFMALLESVARLRDDQRLASWLMSVARRLAWRQRRRSDREILLPGVSLPEDPFAQWEREALVHEALQRLGEACRDLLIALYFHPAAPSYAEVAERFGRAIGGIGPMRARCLQHLRTLLGEDVQA